MAPLLKLQTLFRPPPPPPRTSGPAPFVPTTPQPRASLTPSAQVIRKPLDTFAASPTKPPLVDLGGKEAGVPVPPYPHSLDILRYELAQRQEPQREDFSDPREYNAAHTAWERKLQVLEEAAGDDYLADIEKKAQETPTGNAIIDAAREAGVEVVVLPNAEYDRRYPDTGGVNDGGVVYVPTRSIDDTSDPEDVDVVVHEYVHALLGDKLDPNNWQLLRPFQAAQAFAELGLPPEAGVAVAEQTSGWEDGVAVQHVVTAYITRRTEREREGLPPESPAEEAAAIERISDRELALHLQRARDGESPPSDEQLVEEWENTPTGQRYPPEGDTLEEKAAWIEEQMATLADPAYVDPPSVTDKTED